MDEESRARLQKLEEKVDKLLDKFKVIKDLNSNMQALKRSQDSFNLDIEDFRTRLDTSLKEFVGLKKTVLAVQAENISLRNELKMLRNSLEDNYYLSKSCEIEIVGIPPAPAENLKEQVLNIAKKVGVKLPECKVKFVQRVSLRQGKLGHVSVCFADCESRASFLEKARKAKLVASDIGHAGARNMIYFNECLSQYSRQLLFKAKEFQKSEKWRFVWVKSGKVYLRKAEGEPAIRISCQDDLVVLKSS